MSITESQVKAQIILEVGDVDPATGDPVASPATGIIASRIDYLWDRYAAQDQVAAGLRELYARRAAIRLVLGVLSPRRFDSGDTLTGVSVRAHQLVESYQAMLDAVNAELTAHLKAASGGVGAAARGGPYVSARLTRRAPVLPCAPPDPSALRYGGAPPNVDASPAAETLGKRG